MLIFFLFDCRFDMVNDNSLLFFQLCRMSRISLGTFYDTIQFKQRHTHTKQSGKNNERTQNKEFQLNGAK